MSRKVVLLNLALLALAGVLVWSLRTRSLAAHAHERAILEQKIRARGVPAPPPPALVKPVAASEYLEVAQKMLFSKDRNPAVAVDVPKPPPEPPVPPLPNFHGMIGLFGDPVIILSVGKNGPQKGYHVGDDVGPFKLVSFNREDITLEWRGKQVNSSLEKLVPESDPPPQAPAAAQQQQQAQPSPVTALAPAAVSLSNNGGANNGGNNGPPSLGVDMGGGFRACQMGDASPAGTILQGYRKVVAATLMGNSCHWELVK